MRLWLPLALGVVGLVSLYLYRCCTLGLHQPNPRWELARWPDGTPKSPSRFLWVCGRCQQVIAETPPKEKTQKPKPPLELVRRADAARRHA